MKTFDLFLFGIYPYIALTVFFLGSLFRFDREQYTWKSDSSQLLYSGSLRLGNILFHIGIIGLFFGHLVGLLTPAWVWGVLGISHSAKQAIAIWSGGTLGIICLIGLVILIQRRLTNPRLAAVTQPMDKLLLVWILITLLLGLSTLFVSVQHSDGGEMVKLMYWAQHVVTLRGGVAVEYLTGVSALFKAHLFMGMTLFLIFPFTRLVHVWSGFATVFYLGRAWQLVRQRQ